MAIVRRPRNAAPEPSCMVSRRSRCGQGDAFPTFALTSPEAEANQGMGDEVIDVLTTEILD